MQQLFTPWRAGYVAGERETGCFLCRAAAATDAAESLVVEAGDEVLVLLNRYPYSNGHLLVAPRRHAATFEELPPEVAREIWDTVVRSRRILDAVLHADGYNLGCNLGAAAGAGLIEHLHAHVVPRWEGDANFMTTVGSTRVVPGELTDTCRRLREAFADGAH